VLIDQGNLKSSVKHLQNFLDLRPTASNAVLIRQKMEEITASIQNATRNAPGNILPTSYLKC
jgi:regulator of sirC expression with transglutaminase-like and TPR domain